MKYLKLLKEKQIIALAPYYSGLYSSVIYTHQGTLYFEETVENLMDQFCMTFGSTLKGRIEASRKSLKYRKNPPILISEKYRIGAFQVPDIRKIDMTWIFDLQFDIKPIDSQMCELIFAGNLKLTIPLSEMAIIERRRKTLEALFTFTLTGHQDSTISK
ncbi:hypothetical protein MTP04_08480 [Lysinibacillus sp. PLM2]|nr:hypothetical protein MTP04_08480 [Lysinibacillus sp. PLM2]